MWKMKPFLGKKRIFLVIKLTIADELSKFFKEAVVQSWAPPPVCQKLFRPLKIKKNFCEGFKDRRVSDFWIEFSDFLKRMDYQLLYNWHKVSVFFMHYFSHFHAFHKQHTNTYIHTCYALLNFYRDKVLPNWLSCGAIDIILWRKCGLYQSFCINMYVFYILCIISIWKTSSENWRQDIRFPKNILHR